MRVNSLARQHNVNWCMDQALKFQLSGTQAHRQSFLTWKILHIIHIYILLEYELKRSTFNCGWNNCS